MSFSGDVKTELCRGKISRSCCAVAEALGVLLYCNQFSRKGIKIVTESAAFSQRLPLLFRKAFGVNFDQAGDQNDTGKQIFLVNSPGSLLKIWDVCGGDIAHHINFAFLEEEHCQFAFLRGVFLSGGSVTDPQKGYHLELVTSHLHVNREIQSLFLDLGHRPKETTRKSNYITYFKQSDHIEDFLTAIGAPVSAMEIMTTKAEKTLRNGVNRRVNCDAANADKTVDAAQSQIAAVRLLTGSGKLIHLSEKLQEAAHLRLENPDIALSELAGLCDPPVTKSCLNHRLRKLVSLSQEED